MSDKYTINDVTEDLRSILALTNLYAADDKGFWILQETGERYKHKLDGEDQGREIVLFQDPMPRGDYLYFNPFSEGFGKANPATTFFYNNVRAATNVTILTVLVYVARLILTGKEKAKLGEEFAAANNPTVVAMSSVPIGKRETVYDVIDQAMIGEFVKLIERTNNTVIHVPYYHNQVTAKVTSAVLTDPEWDAKYATKDIRKKSVLAFKALLMGVLGITKPEDLSQFTFKYDHDLKSAPKFHATMSVYLRLYSRFNELVADAYATDADSPLDTFVVDLGKLAETIERFPMAYAIAKHMIQPTVSSIKPVETTTSNTQGLRFTQAGQAAGGTQSRFSGPPTLDSFGRMTRPGTAAPAPSGGLSFAAAPTPGTGRFQPHVLSNAPADPFAPSTKQAPPSMFGGGAPGGFGHNSAPFGMNNGMSTGFGGGGFGDPMAPLSFSTPSNFNQPGTRQWFP